MVGEFEGLGEAVTGAMAGRAVEPESGDEPRAMRMSADCLNCRAALTGSYCARCGQKAHVHRTMGAFFHDLLHGVLHVDGKAWQTLPLLAWQPGKLTRRYIDGQRARFVSPMALFLFSVFVMFAMLNLTIDSDGMGAYQLGSSLERSQTETQTARLRSSRTQKQALKPGPEHARPSTTRLARQREDLKEIENLRKIAQRSARQAQSLARHCVARGPTRTSAQESRIC